MSSPHLGRFRRWLFQSPPAEWVLHQLRELMIGALKQGPIPQHIAFVMDGNRRYARKNQVEVVEGHNMGFEAVARVLEVCYKAGVKVVTIYAFSIENFKRSKYEVDGLMEIAKTRLTQLAQHGELFDRYGASVRILGQRELVRPDVLEAVDEAVNLTKHNNKAILNVCFPYTAREEMTTAIRSTVAEYAQPVMLKSAKRQFSERHITQTIQSRRLSTLVEEQESPLDSAALTPNEPATRDLQRSPFSSSTTLNHDSSPNNSYPHSPDLTSTKDHTTLPDPENITEETLTNHMFTSGNPPLDLLIRTSGVTRLSDFMLWQCHENTSIVFLNCLWPEFDLWHFLPVLVEWQWWRRKDVNSVAMQSEPALVKVKAH